MNNTCVILGQFTNDQIKKLFLNELSPTFIVEADLTMVHWPLKADELKKYSTRVAMLGHYWVVCDKNDENHIRNILNS